MAGTMRTSRIVVAAHRAGTAIQAFMEKAIPGPNNTAVAAQSGRYDDTLVREDGKWKFKRRVAANDIPAGGPPQVQLTK